MIAKPIDENSVALIPEESDDLFTLRRIIKKEDRLTGETTRAIKQEKDFSRPDRGERIKIRVALDVEKISIDDVVDRLKAHGTIISPGIPVWSRWTFGAAPVPPKQSIMMPAACARAAAVPM